MNVSVKFFALARQQAGCEEMSLSLQEGATVSQFRDHLAAEVPAVAEVLAHAMVALNQQYATNDQVIPAESELAIIPPVSGG